MIDGEDVVLSSPKPSSSPPPPSIESLSSSSTSTSNSQSSAWEYWARLKSPPFLDDDQDGDEDNDNYDDNDSVDNSNSEKSLSRPGSIVIQDDDDESTNDREERFLRMLGPAFSKYDVEFMHRFADYAKEVDNEKVWDVLDTMDALMHDIVGWRCQLLQNYQELRLISPAFCSYNTPKKRAGADDNIFVTASSSSLENTGQLPPTRKLRNKFHVGDQRHIRWQACYNNYTKCSKLTEEKILLATRLFFELKAWEEGGRGVTGSVRSAIHNR